MDNEQTAASVSSSSANSAAALPTACTRRTDGRRFLPHQSRRRLHLHHEMRRGTRRDRREREERSCFFCRPHVNHHPTDARAADRGTNPLCRPAVESIHFRTLHFNFGVSADGRSTSAWPSSCIVTSTSPCFLILNQKGTNQNDKTMRGQLRELAFQWLW